MRFNFAKNRNSLPTVSVVIPVYNSAKYLRPCLDSVIAQTYPNIEIICIDDGSTDNSLKIIREYATKNSSFVVIEKRKNSGVVRARNSAIERATGKYVLPLDSDDIITKDCVEKLYEVITKTRCGVAAPTTGFIGAKVGIYDLPGPTPRNMALQNCITSCALFEKESWEKYGGYDEQFKDGLEDYDFWWNFVQDHKKIIRVPEILFYYRIKSEHESRNIQTKDYHEGLLVLMSKKYSLMRKLQRPPIATRVRSILARAKNYIILRVKRYLIFFLRFTNIFRWRQYKNYVLNQQLDKKDFVQISNDKYIKKTPPKKLIAYYLPQYYQIPQNDVWFGRGFTEWSNCAKAVPQFVGHWQPHLPIDVGFYDLETTRIMHRQVELAKMYGIYGFCFYYYWFSGGDKNKIMEKPVYNWLKDKTLDFPFMLFWANEDWTNTWGEQADRGTKTYSAKMQPSDVEKFVDDILPLLQDERYIKIDGRPHLIIYQAKKDPYLPEFIKKIGKLIEKNGVKKPYISLVFPDESPETFDPREFGADAAVEFAVHMKIRPDYIQRPVKDRNRPIINPLAHLTTYDMDEFINSKRFLYQTDYPVFKGAMTTFDNTARKIYTNAITFPLSPDLYQKWLSELVKTSTTDYIFIAAWNEWAEGMHLEPDQRFGYAYLQATKNALKKTQQTNRIK